VQNQIKFISGNEACAEGAFYAGARFYAGYPITPSSEIAQIASERLPALGGWYMQMEDELASMAAIIGASCSGVKSFTATSGPGFSLMQENLGVAIMGEIPCVLINVQRSGPSTGLATSPAQADFMQSRWGTHGDHSVIVLTPSSVQECYELTIRAFNLSEKYRTPVILLTDKTVAQMREKATLFNAGQMEIINRKKPDPAGTEYIPYKPDPDNIPPMSTFGDPQLLRITSSTHSQYGFTDDHPDNADSLLKRLFIKIENNVSQISCIKNYFMEDAETAFVSFGITARAAYKAVKDLRREGVKAGLVNILTAWPFPDQKLEAAVAGCRELVVAEMNLGQLVREVRRVCCDKKIIACNKSNGENILPNEIVNAWRGAL
jgi:2-oxoglutarate/2-oxoacid ferredoxin oxidoreductase subunit alpha